MFHVEQLEVAHLSDSVHEARTRQKGRKASRVSDDSRRCAGLHAGNRLLQGPESRDNAEQPEHAPRHAHLPRIASQADAARRPRPQVAGRPPQRGAASKQRWPTALLPCCHHLRGAARAKKGNDDDIIIISQQ
eukprot:1960715-Pleurochrysis_carterae.AAC.1